MQTGQAEQESLVTERLTCALSNGCFGVPSAGNCASAVSLRMDCSRAAISPSYCRTYATRSAGVSSTAGAGGGIAPRAVGFAEEAAAPVGAHLSLGFLTTVS